MLKSISWLPFNDGDIYLLATGKYIFVWTGRHANKFEKIQAIRIAEELKSEHSNYVESIVVVEDGKELFDLSGEELAAFEKFLPLDKKVVDTYNAVEDETKYENAERADLKLYRCNEENGTPNVAFVKNGPLLQNDLDTNDTFIIDNDVDGIWVWVGKKASKKERTEAMKYAHQLIKINNYNPNTKITKLIQDGEHIEFKSLFKSWTAYGECLGPLRPKPVGRVATVLKEGFDANKLAENHSLAAETQLVDNGRGKKQVYYVKNLELRELKEEDWGNFFSENCYVIVYTNNENTIIYFWVGLNSYADERNLAEEKAIEMDANIHSGAAVLARIVECDESLHFMLLFSGLMTILKGRYVEDRVIEDSYLLQVKGTTDYNCKAVQVDCKAASLNSNCVFVLTQKNKKFLWFGKESSGEKVERARKIALKEANKDYFLIKEGEETEDFWNAINGKDGYESDKRDKIDQDFHVARLFCQKKIKGKLTFSEVINYSQNDLIQDEFLILDSYDVIFVWVGSQVEGECILKRAFKIAKEFVQRDAAVRDDNLPVIVVKQDNEPSNFTGFFLHWDKTLWKKAKSYDQMKSELRKLIMDRFPIQA